MKIVDAQVHIWAADTPTRPWPKAGEGGRNVHVQRAEPWTAEEVIAGMDAAGVDAAILVPPSWEGERNDLALDAVHRYPGRFAIMGRLRMDDASNHRLLADWRAQPGMLGVRLVFSKASPWIAAGVDHWLWSAAEEAGVPITLFPLDFYPLVESIAAKHPRLRLSIDHMGCIAHDPSGRTFAHLPRLLALARFPNVAVKATSLPNYCADPWPFPSTHEPLRRVLDAFGPRRVFWGTDLSRLPCPYRQAVTMFSEALPWLRGPDLDWVMGRGVCEWFGLDNSRP